MHLSYIQTKYNGKEESINKIFSTYIEPLLNCINHPTLMQQCKLNIDAPEYEKQINVNMNRPSDKNKFIIMISKRTGQSA